MSIVWQWNNYPFKVKYRDHYCYKCRSILTVIELGRTVHITDEGAELYDFPYQKDSRYSPAHPVEECTFFRKAFLCQKCDYTIEIPTQITLEDTDIYLKRIQKRYYKKHKVLIKRVFETNDGNMLEIFKSIDDIKNLTFSIFRNGKELAVYRSEIKRKEESERAHYFKIDKAEFKKVLNSSILRDDVSNTLRLHLSEYLGENDIVCSIKDDVMIFAFKIKEYDIGISFDTLIESYKIKIENTTAKTIQNTIRPTMSKYYAQDLKNIMKDYKLSGKDFVSHVTGLALIMKKYLDRTGNLRFFEQAYYPEYKIDGIVI